MDIELCLIKRHLNYKGSVFYIEKGIEPEADRSNRFSIHQKIFWIEENLAKANFPRSLKIFLTICWVRCPTNCRQVMI